MFSLYIYCINIQTKKDVNKTVAQWWLVINKVRRVELGWVFFVFLFLCVYHFGFFSDLVKSRWWVNNFFILLVCLCVSGLGSPRSGGYGSGSTRPGLGPRPVALLASFSRGEGSVTGRCDRRIEHLAFYGFHALVCALGACRVSGGLPWSCSPLLRLRT